jgi:hypothetical protein
MVSAMTLPCVAERTVTDVYPLPPEELQREEDVECALHDAEFH